MGNADGNGWIHPSYAKSSLASSSRSQSTTKILLSHDNDLDRKQKENMWSSDIYSLRNTSEISLGDPARTQLGRFYQNLLEQSFFGKIQTIAQDPRSLVLLVRSNISSLAEGSAHEFKTVIGYTVAATIFLLLQYVIQFSSGFILGHIGKLEISAFSLCNMTSGITAYTLIQGISSCLETICSQAHGSKNKKLIGLYYQRCLFLISLFFIPIGFLWYHLEHIFLKMKVDPALSKLVGQYMKILFFNVPAYALFDTLKRFLNAQEIFRPVTFVMMFVAPLNIVLNLILVRSEKLGFGISGAATSTTICVWMQFLLLLLYTMFVDGYQDWTGFTKEGLKIDRRMAKLALSGTLMITAEWVAFEMSTFSASYLGTNAIAAQSVLVIVAIFAYQIPTALAYAASARVGTLLGSGNKAAAKKAAFAAVSLSFFYECGVFILLNLFRHPLSRFLVDDVSVQTTIPKAVLVFSLYQFFDGLSGTIGGVIRGTGLQGKVALVGFLAYNCWGFFVGYILTFKFRFGLNGLWFALLSAVLIFDCHQLRVLYTSPWKKSAE